MKKILLQSAISLDAGEEETIWLAYSGSIPDVRICLAEAAAIKCAVLLGLGDRCVSLEMVLRNCGLTKKVKAEYTDKWFCQKRKEAEILRVQQMFE